jgi:hypothetical protein
MRNGTPGFLNGSARKILPLFDAERQQAMI